MGSRHLAFFNSLFLLALLGLLFLGCGPTIDEGVDAKIRVMPPKQLVFTRVVVGQSNLQPIVISNLGRDPLSISELSWEGSSAVTLKLDDNTIPRSLASNASFAVGVEFAPSQTVPAPEGRIVIRSNDIDKPVYYLDVIAQQLLPSIHVVPSREEGLHFGQTEIGDTSRQRVVITNTGDLPLLIENIELPKNVPFDYLPLKQATLPLKLLANGQNVLELELSFKPSTIGKHSANLVIVSNDPQSPRYTLPIVANSDTPCIRIQPSLLEFTPAVSIGTTHKKEVLLTSCGDVPLTIKDVVKQEGNEAFVHKLQASAPLKNGESAKLEIQFSPPSAGTYKAQYTIVSDDPLQPNAVLDVLGVGSANQCPQAVIRGRISASSAWSKQLDAAPLDTIMLDASLSQDPESSTLKYHWIVDAAPMDSTSKIAENNESASFFADLAGHYKLCLSVEDEAGMMSCNTDCIEVSAIPRETLHVQLVWHTPNDKLIGDDDGSDLDLHFVRLPLGHWGDKGEAELNNGSDVYFLNRQPVWYYEGIGNVFPSLDRDDKDGEGPENVNLDKPPACSWFGVGAHYYRDNAFGASYATLRIYISGKLRFEKANISLLQTGVFKQIALIHWDGSTARVYESPHAYQKDIDWIGQEPILPDAILQEAKKAAPQCF